MFVFTKLLKNSSHLGQKVSVALASAFQILSLPHQVVSPRQTELPVAVGAVQTVSGEVELDGWREVGGSWGMIGGTFIPLPFMIQSQTAVLKVKGRGVGEVI